MNHIAAFVLIITFVFFALKSNFATFIGVKKHTFLLIFFIHLFSGLILTYIYTNFYSSRSLADTFKYFDDSNKIFELFFKDSKVFWKLFFGDLSSFERDIQILEQTNTWFPESRRTFYNDNRTIVRINLILRFLSFGSYYFHLIAFIIMSILGKSLIYKVGKSYLTGKETLWFVIVFFIPSIIFWSTGILKEGPLFLILGSLIFQLDKLYTKGFSLLRIIKVLLLIGIMVFIKFYVLIFMIPALLIFIQLNNLKIGTVKILFINFIVFIVSAQLWHLIHPRWSMFTILKWKKNDFIGLAEVEQANSFIQTRYLDDNLWSFLLNIPQSAINSIIQPTIFNITNMLSALAAFENIVILLVVIFCIRYGSKRNINKVGVFSIVYAISFLTITAMITPIIGSLVRYKIPVLPFFLFFFIQFLNPNIIPVFIQKIINKIHKLFLL